MTQKTQESSDMQNLEKLRFRKNWHATPDIKDEDVKPRQYIRRGAFKISPGQHGFGYMSQTPVQNVQPIDLPTSKR